MSEGGTVGARAVREGRTGSVAADAVRAVAGEVAIVDPGVVVLGRLIATAGDLLVEPSRTEAGRRMSPRTVPKIVPSVLGDDPAAIGAAPAAMLQP